MKKNKWRINRNGEVIYGYKCYNQLNNGSKKIREDAGISTDGYCDLREICDWKLELMACKIFRELGQSYKDAVRQAYDTYAENFRAEKQQNYDRRTELLAQLDKLKKKLDNLTEMRMEGELTKAEFQEHKQKLSVQISAIEQELIQVESQAFENKQGKLTFEQISEVLTTKMDFTQSKLDRQFLEHNVYRIIPVTEYDFAWYLNLLPHQGDWISEGKEICTLSVDFKEAREYRKQRKGMLRKNQWHDLTIRIYA